MCGDFLNKKKTEGSTAGRLPMFLENKKPKIIMLYKTEHNETQQKTEN